MFLARMHVLYKRESKLELAASMVRQIMPEFKTMKNVIILCDSWYVRMNIKIMKAL